MSSLLVVVAALIVGRVVISLLLDRLNRAHVGRHAAAVPPAFQGLIDESTYAKSVDYTFARSRYGSFETLYDSAWLAVFLFSGMLPWLFARGESWLGSSIWAHAALLFVISFLMGLPGLPLDWWETFRLEERFGFNKTSPRTWVSDKLKGLVLNLVIVYPLLCLLLWLVTLPHWWIVAAVVVLVFQLAMIVIFPMFIMPLFNKFTPLPEGALRERLMSLAQRTGFAARTILVMDGSKRSAHSNAFFAGLGRFRRIVLFDTLVEQLESEELEAVLAHEIGHYKLGHIPKSIAVSAVATLGGFAVLAWLAGSPWFVESFGFHYVEGQLAPALLLFGMTAGLVAFWFSPLLAQRSRKHEYEADAFSRRAMGGDPMPLVGALRKLHTKNLSNLTPHPLYSAFHYSHPTLVEREAALKEKAER